MRGKIQLLLMVLLLLAAAFIILPAGSYLQCENGSAPPIAAAANPGSDFTDDLHGAELIMVWIPPGIFMMGSDTGPGHEQPVHRVRITRGFWIGKYEVTQAQWTAIMDSNPSEFKGRNHPVENVSWFDCQEFLTTLSQKTGTIYRLPTEAEWEYACRAGSVSDYYFGDDVDRLGAYAWHSGNAGQRTRAVGLKEPNSWGLHDMLGSVWEWCGDHAVMDGGNSYRGRGSDDPTGPSAGDGRIVRGGSWFQTAPGEPDVYRCSSRAWDPPSDRFGDLGFRAVAVAP